MIIYSIVAQNSTILAEYAVTTGNFASIAELILAKIPTDRDSQMSFVYDKYFFHYLRQNEITFLCLAEDIFCKIFLI